MSERLRYEPIEMSVLASDGLVLKGEVRYPDTSPSSGRHPLAVLAHQYPSTRASYAPLIHDLLQRGIATLAFDLRGHGASILGPSGPVVIDTPNDFGENTFAEAFVGSIQRVGFARISDDIIRVTAWGAAQNGIDPGQLLLVGASVGGTGALLAAGSIPALRGVLTFGASGAPAHGDDTDDRIRRTLQAASWPALLTTSHDDPFDGRANIARWADGVSTVQREVVPGALHAMAIYPVARAAALQWLDTAVALT